MAPFKRRSPPRQHRSRPSATSSSHDSSLVSAYSGSGISPRERPVISHPASQSPRRISRHHPLGRSYRLPRLSLERHVSNGSYFQGTRRRSRVRSRVMREALAASEELQQMLNRDQAQRSVSSREPTRRLASAWDPQQRGQRSLSDEAVEQGPHRPTFLDLIQLPSAWGVDGPIYNASQNYLSARNPTHLASNEALYGQRQQQQQQTLERLGHSHRLSCPRSSPVSPCERGQAMSEEQRNRLLCSMPGYQSSSSSTAEPTPTAQPTLRPGRLAPVEQRRSSTDVGMHDIMEDPDSERLKEWPANGNTLASTGHGGRYWSSLENAGDNISSASHDWSMNNASSNYQAESPLPHRNQAVLDSDGQRRGYLPRGQELTENSQDVEILAQQLQNQRLADKGA